MIDRFSFIEILADFAVIVYLRGGFEREANGLKGFMLPGLPFKSTNGMEVLAKNKCHRQFNRKP